MAEGVPLLQNDMYIELQMGCTKETGVEEETNDNE
jgi:hypothetical protein